MHNKRLLVRDSFTFMIVVIHFLALRPLKVTRNRDLVWMENVAE